MTNERLWKFRAFFFRGAAKTNHAGNAHQYFTLNKNDIPITLTGSINPFLKYYWSHNALRTYMEICFAAVAEGYHSDNLDNYG